MADPLLDSSIATEQPQQQQQPTANPTPKIHTYHCLCSNLLLATTYALSTLHRRAGDSLDHALILPSPPVPRHLLSTAADSDSDSDDPPPAAQGTPSHLTVAIALPRSAQPIVVRRSDGFEKRWLLRCGRCRLVVGYQLAKAQFGEGGGAEGEGRREDVMYILPGALSSTEDMVEGRKVPESEVAFAFAADAG